MEYIQPTVDYDILLKQSFCQRDAWLYLGDAEGMKNQRQRVVEGIFSAAGWPVAVDLCSFELKREQRFLPANNQLQLTNGPQIEHVILFGLNAAGLQSQQYINNWHAMRQKKDGIIETGEIDPAIMAAIQATNFMNRYRLRY